MQSPGPRVADEKRVRARRESEGHARCVRALPDRADALGGELRFEQRRGCHSGVVLDVRPDGGERDHARDSLGGVFGGDAIAGF